MVFQDWADALCDLPDWAIDRAVRWWKSADNPDRRRKPLEGDIAERARMEQGIISLAKARVDEFQRTGNRPRNAPNEPAERATPEAKARILKELNFDIARAGRMTRGVVSENRDRPETNVGVTVTATRHRIGREQRVQARETRPRGNDAEP